MADFESFFAAAAQATNLIGFPLRFEFKRLGTSLALTSIETTSQLLDDGPLKVLAALADDHRIHIRILEDDLVRIEDEYTFDLEEIGFVPEPTHGGVHRPPCSPRLLDGTLVYVTEATTSGSSVPPGFDLAKAAWIAAAQEWRSFIEAERMVRMAWMRFDKLCEAFVARARNESGPIHPQLLHGRRRYKRYQALREDAVLESLDLELACQSLVGSAGSLDDKIANLALQLNRQLGNGVWTDADKDDLGVAGHPPMQDRKNCRARLYATFGDWGGEVKALQWLQDWRNDVLHREHMFVFVEIDKGTVLFSNDYAFEMVDPRLGTCVSAPDFTSRAGILLNSYLRWFLMESNEQVQQAVQFP